MTNTTQTQPNFDATRQQLGVVGNTRNVSSETAQLAQLEEEYNRAQVRRDAAVAAISGTGSQAVKAAFQAELNRSNAAMEQLEVTFVNFQLGVRREFDSLHSDVAGLKAGFRTVVATQGNHRTWIDDANERIDHMGRFPWIALLVGVVVGLLAAFVAWHIHPGPFEQTLADGTKESIEANLRAREIWTWLAGIGFGGIVAGLIIILRPARGRAATQAPPVPQPYPGGTGTAPTMVLPAAPAPAASAPTAPPAPAAPAPAASAPTAPPAPAAPAPAASAPTAPPAPAAPAPISTPTTSAIAKWWKGGRAPATPAPTQTGAGHGTR